MQILCLPDKFKGTLTSAEAAAAMTTGFHRVDSSIQVDCHTMADGGEGTADALAAIWESRAGPGSVKWTESEVVGPHGSGQPVAARWAQLHRPQNTSQKVAELLAEYEFPIAMIELASAAGLHLVADPNRDANPIHTTTFGVGELIQHAIQAGCSTILVGLGGSCTCDGGAGLIQALGANITPVLKGKLLSGGQLRSIEQVGLSPAISALQGCSIIGLCDVTNPLLGPTGSAHTYAPQKGANDDEVRLLEDGLTHWANLVASATESSVNTQERGMGAAGGVGYCLSACLGGSLISGIGFILDLLPFEERAKHTDLICTGEGCIDTQSRYGKVVHGITQRAQAMGKDTLVLVGSIAEADGEFTGLGIQPDEACFMQIATIADLPNVKNVDEAKKNASKLLSHLAERELRRYLSRT